ncbi:TetR/AcrR family transcriptional regulator [Thiovibrio sp. JS02]
MEKCFSLPKPTFRNLPPEKQENILRAAVAEFAELGYQRASVNSIVKRLGIAKGSLYQYFDNKEALFLHVFDQFTRQVKLHVKNSVALERGSDFFALTKEVLLAGIGFIGQYPEFFQVYLKVLFEQDVPKREKLVAQVRLFSLEYFGPLCELGKEEGVLRRDLSCRMVVFILDATMDRFLQAYAQPYLDGGLSLADMAPERLHAEIDTIITVLRNGLQP